MHPTYALAMRAAKSGSARARPWYLYPRNDAEVVRRLAATFAATSSYHQDRLRDSAAALWLYLADKYGDMERRPGWLSDDRYVGWWGEGWYRNGPRSNMVKLNVDALTAWLFADPPRLEVRSNGAPFELRRAVEDRSLALDATVNETDAKIALMDIGRDGWLTGFGAGLPLVRQNRVEYRRLLASQLWWDPTETTAGKQPWSIVLCELRDRWDLCGWYEGLDREHLELSKQRQRTALQRLERLAPTACESLYDRDAYQTPHEWQLQQDGAWNGADQVLVVHAWRRSRTTDSDQADGRYVMLAAGPSMAEPVLLCDLPYLWADLPVCWWAPYPDPSGGLTGIGISHVLRSHQRSKDKSDAIQQRNVDTFGHTKVLVDAMGPSAEESVLQEYFDLGITVVSVAGMQAPQVVQPPVMSEGQLAWSREIERRAANDSGVPAVIQSGQTTRGAGAPAVAMVEEASLGTDRLSDAYSRWQRFRIRVGTCTLEAIEDALALDQDFEVSFQTSDGRPYTRNWSQIHRLNETWQVSVETAGAVAPTRNGRMLKILDWTSKGILDPRIANEMFLRTPDARSGAELQRAPVELILDQLDELVASDGDHDRAMAITLDQDLEQACYWSNLYINQAMGQRAEFATVERLRSYYAQAESLRDQKRADEAAKQAEIQAAAATGAAPAGAGPGMPALGPEVTGTAWQQ
jgi:hypothetical protein